MRVALGLVGLLVACRFDSGGVPTDELPIDAPGQPDATPDAPVDAAIDGPPDATICPPDYVDLGVPGSKYRVVGGTATWLEAETDCETDSGTSHLVVFDSADERNAVDAVAGGQVWIGLTDRVEENVFVNVTGGSPLFQDWSPGEPNNGRPFGLNEDCVELVADKYNDEGCDGRQGYVCECDALPAMRDAYTPRP